MGWLSQGGNADDE